MSKESEKNEMREEYDVSQGVRGKYATAYHQGSNLVVLAPNVAERFPNAESVNQALRSLANLDRRKAPVPLNQRAVGLPPTQPTNTIKHLRRSCPNPVRHKTCFRSVFLSWVAAQCTSGALPFPILIEILNFLIGLYLSLKKGFKKCPNFGAWIKC